MSVDQIEKSPGETYSRIMFKDEVKQGRTFWLNTQAPDGQVYYHQRVKVSRSPYQGQESPAFFADFAELDTLVKRDMPLPLHGLGIMLKRPNPRLKVAIAPERTGSWLEPYVEPKPS